MDKIELLKEWLKEYKKGLTDIINHHSISSNGLIELSAKINMIDLTVKKISEFKKEK